jgi:hypothetical protein
VCVRERGTERERERGERERERGERERERESEELVKKKEIDNECVLFCMC